MLKVVRGAADDDEIVALVTAIVAVASGSAPASLAPNRRRTVPPRSAWARPVAPAGTDPDGWRRSGLPNHRAW